MKPRSRLDPVSELAEQGVVLCDPSSTSCPIAEGFGIPVNANVLEMFEHRDAGCTASALWTVEMEVGCELARTQVARHMRVIDQRGQVIHCCLKNWVQTGVGFSLSCAGHHPNIPMGRRQSEFESRVAGLDPSHKLSVAGKSVAR
jgi:NAD-dependent oxidoreductase involved in siderophore biosynthesis